MDQSIKTKYCLVPRCKSNSKANPEKRFLTLPVDEGRRKPWLTAARRDPNDLSKKSVHLICEDHFNLEEDAENYIRVKYYGSSRIKLKPGIVPHIFECQKDRSTAQPSEGLANSVVRARRRLVESLQEEADPLALQPEGFAENVSGPSEEPGTAVSEHAAALKPATSTSPSIRPSKRRRQSFIVTPTKRFVAEALCSLAETDVKYFHRGTQSTPEVQSVGVQANPSLRSRAIQCGLTFDQDFRKEHISPFQVETATSPFKLPAKRSLILSAIRPDSPSESSSVVSIESSSSNEKYQLPTDSSFSDDTEIPLKDLQKLTQVLCTKDPMCFVGLPASWYRLVGVLAKCVRADAINVLICLEKIRVNFSFKILAYHFNVSETFCSKTFRTLLPPLAKCISPLILWPPREEIKKRLPMTFRARYSHVQSIIDCFEVEIQKPTDPVRQTLTWSNYKKCNTLKYLISSTPDGYVNFVSGGFGGRTSDIQLTEQCGYLDVLPDNSGVMADRGFKGLSTALQKKGCVLIRPPSVSTGQKSSKEEVKLSKLIASLRILIERVVRRVREFALLKPHSCVNIKLVKYMDYIVQIVCGLINLQEPLIREVEEPKKKINLNYLTTCSLYDGSVHWTAS